MKKKDLKKAIIAQALTIVNANKEILAGQQYEEARRKEAVLKIRETSVLVEEVKAFVYVFKQMLEHKERNSDKWQTETLAYTDQLINKLEKWG